MDFRSYKEMKSNVMDNESWLIWACNSCVSVIRLGIPVPVEGAEVRCFMFV